LRNQIAQFGEYRLVHNWNHRASVKRAEKLFHLLTARSRDECDSIHSVIDRMMIIA